MRIMEVLTNRRNFYFENENNAFQFYNLINRNALFSNIEVSAIWKMW